MHELHSLLLILVASTLVASHPLPSSAVVDLRPRTAKILLNRRQWDESSEEGESLEMENSGGKELGEIMPQGVNVFTQPGPAPAPPVPEPGPPFMPPGQQEAVQPAGQMPPLQQGPVDAGPGNQPPPQEQQPLPQEQQPLPQEQQQPMPLGQQQQQQQQQPPLMANLPGLMNKLPGLANQLPGLANQLPGMMKHGNKLLQGMQLPRSPRNLKPNKNQGFNPKKYGRTMGPGGKMMGGGGRMMMMPGGRMGTKAGGKMVKHGGKMGGKSGGKMAHSAFGIKNGLVANRINLFEQTAQRQKNNKKKKK